MEYWWKEGDKMRLVNNIYIYTHIWKCKERGCHVAKSWCIHQMMWPSFDCGPHAQVDYVFPQIPCFSHFTKKLYDSIRFKLQFFSLFESLAPINYFISNSDTFIILVNRCTFCCWWIRTLDIPLQTWTSFSQV